MPSMEEDLNEGMTLTLQNGRLRLTRTFLCKDLELPSPGDPEVLRFASALNVTGIPATNHRLDIAVKGVLHKLYATDFNLDPLPPVDAVLKVGYLPNELSVFDPGAGDFGTITIQGGTTLETVETDFDYENLQKPLFQRTPITVEYDALAALSGGAPAVDSAFKPQGAKVPRLSPKTVETYTRNEKSYPATRARQYAGKTNRSAWHGLAPHTVLMTAITYTSSDGGENWTVSYSAIYDPETEFRQWARYILPETGKPVPVDESMLSNENGIKSIVVQGDENFNSILP